MDSVTLGCVLALTAAGFVQGGMGFGFGMVSMSLLPLLMPVQVASPMITVFTLPLVLIGLGACWRDFSWDDCWLLLLGTAVGVPIGVRILAVGSGPLLLRLMGAVLLAFSGCELVCFLRPNLKLALPKWTAAPLGILSGAAGGAFNTGGPPLIAYAYAQQWNRGRILAMLQAVFTLSSVLRIAALVHSGLFRYSMLRLTEVAAAPVLLGLVAGIIGMRRVETEKLRPGVFIFIGAMALKYLVWG